MVFEPLELMVWKHDERFKVHWCWPTKALARLVILAGSFWSASQFEFCIQNVVEMKW